jgi:prepilin-type N-terminal cleavage/methylation domain-containing protein
LKRKDNRHIQSGYTLVEMMIAMALGLVILYTLISGIRMGTQSITISNRLSLQNSIMRAGIMIAHENLDFWTDYDDPNMTTAQRPLFQGGVTELSPAGLPFQPFTQSFNPGGASTDNDPGSLDINEKETGWNSADSTWAAANPRCWVRGNMAEKETSDLRYGRYAIFSNTSASLGPANFATVKGTSSGTVSVGYGTVTPNHNWYYRQVTGLLKALGCYGLLEYLPANAYYAVCGPTGSSPYTSDPGSYGPGGGQLPWLGNSFTSYFWRDDITNMGGMTWWCLKPASQGDGNYGGYYGLSNDDGPQETMRAKFRSTFESSFPFINPNAASAFVPRDPNQMYILAHTFYKTGYEASQSGNQGDEQSYNNVTLVPLHVMPSHPIYWPDLTVSVQHLIKDARTASICRVRWADPLTGDTIELSFSAIGTTFRGARQQRNPNGGWALWNDDSDHSSDPAYKNLDSY